MVIQSNILLICCFKRRLAWCKRAEYIKYDQLNQRLIELENNLESITQRYNLSIMLIVNSSWEHPFQIFHSLTSVLDIKIIQINDGAVQTVNNQTDIRLWKKTTSSQEPCLSQSGGFRAPVRGIPEEPLVGTFQLLGNTYDPVTFKKVNKMATCDLF